MNIELKPCPFCGADAELEHDNDHHGEWFNLGCSRHWDRVAPDDACVGARLWYTEIVKSEDEAIEAWNTRTDATKDAEITRLTAENDRLQKVLQWISYHYDNQDMDHVDFRVQAAKRARAGLEAVR